MQSISNRSSGLRGGCDLSHPDSVHLVEAALFAPASVEMRRARAGVLPICTAFSSVLPCFQIRHESEVALPPRLAKIAATARGGSLAGRIAVIKPCTLSWGHYSGALSQTGQTISQVGRDCVLWIGWHIRHLVQDTLEIVRRGATRPAPEEGGRSFHDADFLRDHGRDPLVERYAILFGESCCGCLDQGG
jgi:hypothetical protein